MKKITIAIASLMAAMSFSAQARELNAQQEQEMFVFCDIIGITAMESAKARDQGKNVKVFKQELAMGLKNMKQPYDWTKTKLTTLDNIVNSVYFDQRVHHFTVNQTKRWYDAACIAEANQGK